jgi:thymidylate synthase
MGLNPLFLTARDLPDAWFMAVDACLEHGRVWTVEKGSYEGQKRWELDHITIHIKHPGVHPLIPEMPEHLSHIPPPTTMEYVHQYLPYLMTAELQPNEQYTYGSRLAGRTAEPQPGVYGDLSSGVVVEQGPPIKLGNPQMDTVVERYKSSRGTNQCSMSIAQPSDIHLPDPPCLREIDTRLFSVEALQEGEQAALHFIIYFRSWDLWNGFPANLAAIRLMQEDMSYRIGVEAGEMIVSSKGLHIYDHAFGIAKLRVSR